jgi:ketosteroid isomerase-like protein
MSQENVEIVRAANEAFVGGDIEAALNALDPEIEWHATVGGIDEGRVYRGRDQVVQAFADYFAVWERMEMRAGHGGGWRLDHLFTSKELCPTEATYHHAWRDDGLSDHSALEVDLQSCRS